MDFITHAEAFKYENKHTQISTQTQIITKKTPNWWKRITQYEIYKENPDDN